MSVDDRALEESIERLRVAFDAAGDRGVRSGACSDSARIWAAALGRPEVSEVESLIDHAVGCAHCDRAWRLAREVAAAADRTGEKVSPGGAPPLMHAMPVAEGERIRRGRPGQRIPWRLVGGFLGAAAAVAVIVPFALRQREPRPPQLRSDDADSIRSLVPPGALPRQRFVLRWTPGPPGTRYTLKVVRRDFTPIYSQIGLERAEHEVPATALAEIPAGAEIFWRVESTLRDGRRLESAAFISRVK